MTNLSNKELSFINFAINEAKLSKCLMTHGCVAVSQGKIIGRGFNHHCNPTIDGFVNGQYTCHAEISAIRNAYYSKINKSKSNSNHIKFLKKTGIYHQDFKKITLYVVRIDQHNNIKNSAPCIDCIKMIRLFGIKRIIYSDDDGNFQKIKPHNYTKIHTSVGRRSIIGNCQNCIGRCQS